jgi:hypothetical protein
MKTVEMEKVLRGADVSGRPVDSSPRGRTMDDILTQAGRHPCRTTGSR